MPIYTFLADDGDRFDEMFTVKDKPDSIVRDGKEYVAQLNFGSYVQVKDGKGTNKPAATWPLESEACGVAPEQVPEAMKEDRRLGVATDYSSRGNPIFTSQKHRKKWCEAHGYYDRNAGAGDPTPQ